MPKKTRPEARHFTFFWFEPHRKTHMANLEKIVDELSSLTVLEAAELAKLLEAKWGVSAAAATAVAPGPATGAITALGLKEAKDLVEGAPKTVKEGVGKEEAAKIKAALEKAGAKVELK